MSATNQFNLAKQTTKLPFGGLAILICSLGLGFVVFAVAETPRTLLAAIAAVIALAILLLCPELSLALYIVIGDLKGDDRVAAILPFDLTLALAGILVAGIVLSLLRGRQVSPMPRAYLLFIVLIAWMAASLAYTPVIDAGLEKLGRLVGITSLMIFAPFFVLGTPQAFKRFFVALGVVAFAICAWSLFALGGSDRLVTPSDNTIGLGHIACALILVIWFAVVPRFSSPWRLATYPLLAVPGIALLGSGSRGPAIACGVVVLLSLFPHRARLFDLGFLAALGLAVLPFLSIPASSLEYLGTLIRSRSAAELLSFRGDLLGSAWTLLQQHPLIGGGIQSFRYYSPNAGVYNWPHNIFLETACELGIPAALVLCVIFWAAIRDAVRQLRDRGSPHLWISEVGAALLAVGIINATNTGDINSDRLTWLFVSLAFVAGHVRIAAKGDARMAASASRLAPAH